MARPREVTGDASNSSRTVSPSNEVIGDEFAGSVDDAEAVTKMGDKEADGVDNIVVEENDLKDLGLDESNGLVWCVSSVMAVDLIPGRYCY